MSADCAALEHAVSMVCRKGDSPGSLPCEPRTFQLKRACALRKPVREWTEPRTENPLGKTKATRRRPKFLNFLVGCEWLEHSTYGLRAYTRAVRPDQATPQSQKLARRLRRRVRGSSGWTSRPSMPPPQLPDSVSLRVQAPPQYSMSLALRLNRLSTSSVS